MNPASNGTHEKNGNGKGVKDIEFALKDHAVDEIPVKKQEEVVLEEDMMKAVSLRKLFSYADMKDWACMIVGAVMAAANGVCMPLFSIIFGSLFTDFAKVAPPGDDRFYRDLAAGTSANFGYLALFSFVASFCQMGLFTITAERQVIRIREAYLEAVLNQEIAWFDHRRSGELASKIAENTVLIKEAMGDKFGNLFHFVAMFLSGFAVGFYFSWKLTLVICALVPFIAIGAYFMMQIMADMTGQSLTQYAKAGAVVDEALQNIRTVVAFNAQKGLAELYDKYLLIAEKSGIKKSIGQGLGLGFVMFTMFAGYSLSFFYGSVLIEKDREQAFKDFPPIDIQACSAFGEAYGFDSVSDFCSSFYSPPQSGACNCGCQNPGSDCLTGGDVVLVFFSVLMGSFALGQAAPSYTALRNGQASAAKIFGIIDRIPVISAANTIASGKKPAFSGKIVLKNIDFAYPTRKTVAIFKQMNLEIAAGKSLALVGGSGCGKSTVVALVQRFYDPDGGNVLYQDESSNLHDLKDLNLSYLRDNIGLVSQEPTLFATSIAENISYGVKFNGKTDLEAIMNAAKKANAYDFIMEFPDKFDTMVGERGAQLSGGQKQRIAIARAILRDPKFLILDEATSALDNQSEKIVQKALDKLLIEQKSTTIVIAHRLSTVRNCDAIAVLGDGKVLEKGTHDELMQKENGFYNMLVSAANKSQESEGSHGDDIDLTRAASLVGLETSKSFSREASKQSIEIKPQEKKGEKKKEELYKVPFRRVFEFCKEEKWWFVPAIISAAVNGAQMPVIAIFFGRISTALIEPDTETMRDNASTFAWAFFGLACAIFLSNLGQFFAFGVIAEKMTRRVRLSLFKAILRQEVGFFDDEKHSIGALSSGLSTDAALVKASVADRFGLAVMNIVTMLGGLIIAFINGWQLTLILLVVFPLVAVSGALQMLVMVQLSRNDDKYMGPAAQILQESVAGIRTVTAFNSRSKVVDLYRSKLVVPMSLGFKKGVAAGLGFGFSNGVMFALYALAFYMGALLIDKGKFNFQQMITTFMAVLMSAMGLGQSAALSPDIAKGSVAISNVFKIIDRKSKVDPSIEPLPDTAAMTNTEIYFHHLKFRYPARPDVEVFKSFSLKIDPGSTVALVGASGSGKSTAIALLERFYDPTEGQISIGDIKDTTQVNVTWLRSQMGLVEQEPRLFATTIRENIRYGKLDATDDEIISASKASNAHNFIMSFPNAYDTLVGDQGAQLSGGQKQRICIARAIIRKPKILLLDEATSALDNQSEKIVQKALDDLVASKTMTTVVIAHRLTTIQNADKIVVMDHGVVVEMGKHEELLKKQGAYSKLWYAQLAQGH